MKSFLLLAFAAFFSESITAQHCEGYYYLNANSEVVMTMYDKKSEESGKSVYKIHNVKKNGSTTIGEFTSEIYDQKGNVTTKGSGNYKCTGGVMFIDARVAMPTENMGAYKGMDVEAEEFFIEYPAKMAAGQSLKDVDFEMSIINNGAKFANVRLKQSSRKIESEESITTPAGTWKCWKISYEGQFKAGIGPVGIPFNFKGVEWFAPGFGVVKTETYTKNGKLAGSTMITQIKK